MTDRIRVVTIVLDRDYRDDDVLPILGAIAMVRGVSEVQTGVVGAQDHVARMVVRGEIERDLRREVDAAFDRVLRPERAVLT